MLGADLPLEDRLHQRRIGLYVRHHHHDLVRLQLRALSGQQVEQLIMEHFDLSHRPVAGVNGDALVSDIGARPNAVGATGGRIRHQLVDLRVQLPEQPITWRRHEEEVGLHRHTEVVQLGMKQVVKISAQGAQGGDERGAGGRIGLVPCPPVLR